MDDDNLDKVINELVKHIESALSVDSDYVDCVRTDLLQTVVGLLKEYKRQDGCPCTHCMEWECDEVCEEYKKWRET